MDCAKKKNFPDKRTSPPKHWEVRVHRTFLNIKYFSKADRKVCL